jgi:Gas vesicle synthesis protein GvpO
MGLHQRPAHGDGEGALAQALRRATRGFVELVGLEPEGVSAAERTKDGWRVCLEVTEMERIPPSTSVMGTYEVTADEGGEITGIRRVRRYHRSQTEG